MRKISSLVVLLVILVITFGMIFVSKPKEYIKSTSRQSIEKSIKLLDNKPPAKNPSKTKPAPQPPKNQPGGSGDKPTDPKLPPGGKGPDQPCPGGCGPNSNCG